MREPFTFISTFSGVGGFDLGLEQAGMTCVAQIEYDPHWRCKNGHEFVPELGEAAGPCEAISPKTQQPCGQPMKPPLPAEKQYRPQVLKRHWPGVARYGDIRAVSLQPNGLQERELGTARSSGTNPKGRKQLPRYAGLQRTTSDEQGEPEQPTAERPVPHAGRRGTGIADLICGGFPCQDLSVAGKRAGLAGSRSGLFWEFARIVSEVRPAWVLIENVPGLLSSNAGDDFALILSALEELGYGWAYRILDSRHFGVPQRRRRVYIVGHSSGRIDYPAAVLFEPEGSTRDSEASGEAGEDVAGEIGDGAAKPLLAKRGRRNNAGDETYVPEVAPTMRAGKNRTGGDRPPGTDVDTVESLVVSGYAKCPSCGNDFRRTSESPICIPCRSRGNVAALLDGTLSVLDHWGGCEDCAAEGYRCLAHREQEIVGALDGTFGHHGLAHSALSAVGGHYIAGTVTGSEGHNGNSNPIPDNYVTGTLGANRKRGGATTDLDNPPMVIQNAKTLRASNYGQHGEPESFVEGQTVRRLTPAECERLQGFPDNWTHGADGPRYAAMGDAVTVPVIRWLGERMMFVEESLRV